MKQILLTLSILMVSMSYAQVSFYDLSATTIDGESFDFESLKGQKVLIVNVASKCGLTPQYEDLEALYTMYKSDNFTIIAFPANNFAHQEPGTDDEIKAFCEANYGVSFPMMSKISVKGDDMHPVYQWLTQKDKNGLKDSKVQWNFQKYLIDEKGHLIEVFSPKTKPLSETITSKIKAKAAMH